MTVVKICGITNLEDAKLAIDLGAKALGFNFYRQSPRYIAPAAAQAIVRGLPAGPWYVGVFVDSLAAEVDQIARQVGLDTLQFHGDETPEYCAGWTSWRVIKAISLKDRSSAEGIKQYRDSADLVLLDAWSEAARGGTGQEASGELLEMALASFAREKVILAGGLNPHNVAEKVKRYQPFAVDVASGVEASPGKKSLERMSAFFEAVKTVEM